jgi:hypothetical protein
MSDKVRAAAMLACMASYAAAAPVWIGTANASGHLRVDGYAVKGSATLFDGSAVETDLASANLRLDKGVEITLGTSSRATLYRDRMVLVRGGSELSAPRRYELDASRVRVTANDPNAHFVVILKPGNSVDVAALAGSVSVANDHDVLLASIPKGWTFSFAMQQEGSNSEFSAVGTVSSTGGHYFLTLTETGVTYELTGYKLNKKFVGKEISVIGTIDTKAAPAGGAAAVVIVEGIVAATPSGGQGNAAHTGLIIGGVAVAAFVGITIAIHEASQSKAPASP